jgi:hypothetical protein
MKTINLSVCIICGLLSVSALIVAIACYTLQFGAISGVLGAVSYLSFKDYKEGTEL